MERVNLNAAGFGRLHYQPVDFINGIGNELFGYCVYGTACCEVEVDCLTGDHHVSFRLEEFKNVSVTTNRHCDGRWGLIKPRH